MTYNKLLAISLAIVMVLGTTPLGFSEPLRVQLEQGIETDQLQCNNSDHVLVLRTNGNVACVTEKSAERTGWEIIIQSNNEIIPVDYEFPITSTSNKPVSVTNTDVDVSSTSTPPSFGQVEISISNLPKVGETADVTITITNDDKMVIFDGITFLSISDNFEFVDPSNVNNHPVLDYIIQKNITLDSFEGNATTTKTITIKAVSDGVGYITGSIGADRANLELFVFENTMLLNDYQKIYGEVKKSDVQTPRIATIIVDGVERQAIVEEEPENSKQTQTLAEAEARVEDNNLTPREITQEWIADGVRLEEIRELLRNGGHTLEEIEAFITNSTEYDKAYTQEAFLPNAFSTHSFILRGKIINTPSVYDPSSITNVYGTTVCGADKNLTTNVISIISKTTNGLDACAKTSQSGLFYITDISIVDPDNDNTTVDLSMFYYTDGQYVDIINDNNNYYSATVYGNVENIFSATWTFNHNLSVYNIYDRAANIQDTLHDAREWFDDEDVDLDPVRVRWQHDESVSTVSYNPGNCGGACYVPSLSTMWLDGTVGTTLGDETRIWTQLHEYGHHVMREAYGTSGWGGCNGSHVYTDVNSETCAWSEGWADYVVHLVTGESRIQWYPGIIIDTEQNAYYNSAGNRGTVWASIDATGDNVGHLSEARVASMLWDLRDNEQNYPNDRLSISEPNLDTMNESDATIFNAFSSTKSIVEQYYTTWNNQNPSNQMTDIATLHYMGFVNTAPVATPKSTINLLQDDNIVFFVRGSDVDGDVLSFTITQSPSDGTLTDNGLGQFDQSKQYRYTPTLGFSGSDSFRFLVNDGTVDSPAIRVDIIVTPIVPITFSSSWSASNQIVLAFSERINKQFTTSDFTLSTGTITGVTNFTDSTIRYLQVSNVPPSTAVDVIYVGSTYNLGGNERLDNGESTTTPPSPIAEVPPVLSTINNVTIREGDYREVDVRATDVNGDAITLTVENAPPWVAMDDNGNGSGEVEITVPNEATGTSYSVTVVATDNDGSDRKTFTINITEVNQDPELTLIGPKTVQERQNLSFIVSATDADRPAQTLTYSITNTPPQLPSDVPANISFNTSTGAFSWTPTNMQTGFHAYVFTVSDTLGGSDSERVEIIVTAIPPPGRTPTPTASSVTTNSVTINWSAPSSTHAIIEYDIFREASPIGTVPASQLSYTDNTVSPSTTYDYTVAAKNTFGSGPESNPLTVTTLDLPQDPTLTITVNSIGGDGTGTFVIGMFYPSDTTLYEHEVTTTNGVGTFPIIDLVAGQRYIINDYPQQSHSFVCTNGIENIPIIRDRQARVTPSAGDVIECTLVFMVAYPTPLPDSILPTDNPVTLSIPVNMSHDDGIQRSSVFPIGQELEYSTFIFDKHYKNAVKFNDVAIPEGAIITDAHVEFTSAQDSTIASQVTIYGEDVDNPIPYENRGTRHGTSIGQRALTDASTTWSIPTWSVNQNDSDTNTPNIRNIIQEIVDRNGWVDGNSISLIFEEYTTTFRVYEDTARKAYTFDTSISYPGNPGTDYIPVLHITYDGDSVTTQ